MTNSNHGPPISAQQWQQFPIHQRLLIVDELGGVPPWFLDLLTLAGQERKLTVHRTTALPAAITSLRDHIFDGVMLYCHTGEPPLSLRNVIQAIHAASSSRPTIIIATNLLREDMLRVWGDCGADDFCGFQSAQVAESFWILRQALYARRVLAENHQLTQAESQRLAKEYEESHRLLEQQRSLLQGLQRVQQLDHNSELESAEPQGMLIDSLQQHYDALLRAHVMMPSGQPLGEIEEFSETLLQAKLETTEVMRLHLRAVESLVDGLGCRSARHAMQRADLLILEIMMRQVDQLKQSQLGHPIPPAFARKDAPAA